MFLIVFIFDHLRQKIKITCASMNFLPCVLVSFILLIFSVTPSNAQYCEKEWQPFLDVIKKEVGEKNKELIVFIGSDGKLHNCFELKLTNSQIIQIESFEKARSSKVKSEENMVPGQDLCIVTKYKYRNDAVRYAVKLPYAEDQIQKKECLVNFEAAVKFYLSEIDG